MKTIKILGLTACFMTTVFALAAFIGADGILPQKDLQKAEGKGFAVVELFTSEGCSSCPPADEVLAKLQKEAKGKAVYLLAYHVDYWDTQGWKDIFSSADYSKRQSEYGHWLNPQIYTPQVILNGREEFVGSEESSIRNAVYKQLSTPSSGALSIQAYPDGAELKISYQSAGVPSGSRLLIAVVQKAAQSKVERGENAGRNLSHVQIVRKLQSELVGTSGNGNTTLMLPNDFNTQNFEIIGLIQDRQRGQILGAAKVDLNAGI